MKGSYAMVDPAGRFFTNIDGEHKYSKSILEIGSTLAIQQMNYSFSKFVGRGGIYDWRRDRADDDINITISGKWHRVSLL